MDLSGRERDKFFLSQSGTSFVDLSYLSGADGIEDGRVFARADLDRDGFEDLVVVSRNAPLLRIYRNTVGPTSGRSFVGLGLEGSASAQAPGRRGASNRDAVGARVTARCGPLHLRRDVELGAGFATVNSMSLTLGLDRCDRLDELSVRFPSGERRTFERLATQRFYRIVEGKGLKELTGLYQVRRSVPSGTPSPAEPMLLDAVRRLAPVQHDLLLVSLWASWCEVCRRDMPRLDALAEILADKLDVIGVSVEPKDDEGTVAHYQRTQSVRHRLLAFDPGVDRAATGLLGAPRPLPFTLVLDTHTGQVLLKTPGSPSRSDLERLLWMRTQRKP